MRRATAATGDAADAGNPFAARRFRAAKGPLAASSPPRPIPAALAPARRSPARAHRAGRRGRGRGYPRGVSLSGAAAPQDERGPCRRAVAAPPARGRQPRGPHPPAAATSGTETPPSAEISTIRRVWMRVTVDGARVVEREVAEGTTIPLSAGSQIVIRAGDAGRCGCRLRGRIRDRWDRRARPATRTFTCDEARRRNRPATGSRFLAYPFLVAIHPVPWIMLPSTLPV